jgi:molybdopterin molybdotransferase
VIQIEEARAIIAAKTQCREMIQVPLKEALGYVLACDVLADDDYPSADRSMMDGYAIAEAQSAGRFRVIGEIAASDVPKQALGSGEAMRIFTGAILPEGTGKVVMQELCHNDGDFVIIPDLPPDTYIRKKAAEAAKHQIVLAAGTYLGAAELAILAQVGCSEPHVFAKPRIRHIELVPHNITPQRGQIRDTNSLLLTGFAQQTGLALDSQLLADDPAAMAAALKGDWDVLLISGGASVGDHDHGADVLRELGFEIHFDQVNLRPGKPLTFATRGRQIAFVIPGNPVSHFVCYHVAIRLALETMMGISPQWDFLEIEIENAELLTPNARDTFWPAIVCGINGKLIAIPQRWSSSGDSFSLSKTNALIRVAQNHPLRSLLLNSIQSIR